jgi:hypothetical protein
MLRRSFVRGCSAARDAHRHGGSGSLNDRQQEHLRNFRKRLETDKTGKNELDGFFEEPSALSPSSGYIGPIKRGQEPLPKWLKLKIPKGTAHLPKYNSIKNSMRSKRNSTPLQHGPRDPTARIDLLALDGAARPPRRVLLRKQPPTPCPHRAPRSSHEVWRRKHERGKTCAITEASVQELPRITSHLVVVGFTSRLIEASEPTSRKRILAACDAGAAKKMSSR